MNRDQILRAAVRLTDYRSRSHTVGSRAGMLKLGREGMTLHDGLRHLLETKNDAPTDSTEKPDDKLNELLQKVGNGKVSFRQPREGEPPFVLELRCKQTEGGTVILGDETRDGVIQQALEIVEGKAT